MSIAIIIFPGSTGSREIARCIKDQTNISPLFIWHEETIIPKEIEKIIIPGGSAFGDYIRPGMMAAKSPIINGIIDEAKKGKYIIGIGNGFQILTEAELLPGVFLMNDCSKVVNKNVYLKVTNNTTALTGVFELNKVLNFPISHLYGNYCIDDRNLSKLESQELILFKYCDKIGNVNSINNPNGSMNNIAGICNSKKNIIGIMPHPERVYDINIGHSKDVKYMFMGLTSCTV